MIKWDGHTHTEYCPHGTVADTEQLIQKAIGLGFKRYSITEHAPLPPNIGNLCGGLAEVWETGSMRANDLDHYFKRMEQLQKKYAADIELRIGFEIDFLRPCISWTRDFLEEYGPRTTDNLLSVHFLDGHGGLRGIDYSAADYKEGIVAYYGSFAAAQEAYYDAVIASLQVNLGQWKPKRLGHISLCRKFALAFAETTEYTAPQIKKIDQLFRQIKTDKYTLDLNTAGLYKADCQDTYPPGWLIEKAIQAEIPLVYGSDSHALADVGRGYEQIENFIS